MSGHRQAAVALHALAESDCDLILAELPAADQATLRGYLRELRELGFAAGPELGAAAGKAGDPDPLANADAAAMLAVFAHEPAALLGQFLSLRDWRWGAELLAMLPPSRREQVRAAMAAAMPAPARRRFLLEAAAQRLADSAAPAGARPAAGPLARLGTPRKWPLVEPLLQRIALWTR